MKKQLWLILFEGSLLMGCQSSRGARRTIDPASTKLDFVEEKHEGDATNPRH
jgi:hypothetical protein